MTSRTTLSPVVLFGIALTSAGCDRGCVSESAPARPLARPAQQQPTQPTETQPTETQPAPGSTGATPTGPAWAAQSPAAPEPPQGADLTRDLDLDGTPDAYVASSCTVARHVARGWVSVALGTRSQPENTVCGAPLSVGGRWLIPITGNGHETDEGRSHTWEEAALIAFQGDAASTEVWNSRVEENSGHPGGEYRFEMLGSDAVLISAQMGDATPQGQSGPMFQVLRFDPNTRHLSTSSCWLTTRPSEAPTGAKMCTVAVGSSFHLRDTQTLSSENTSSFPAGSSLAVLARGTLRRGEATLHCVRAPDGQVGYAFITPAEAQVCPSPLPSSN